MALCTRAPCLRGWTSRAQVCRTRRVYSYFIPIHMHVYIARMYIGTRAYIHKTRPLLLLLFFRKKENQTKRVGHGEPTGTLLESHL